MQRTILSPRQKKIKGRARVVSFFLLIVIVIVGVYLYTRFPQSAQAAWYDDNFAYRQTITFTHNASVSSETRVSVTINTSTLISAGKMQSSCADTRFTDNNGKKIRYQLVSGCNTSTTSYSVGMPSISNGTNYLYIYYGNAQALSESLDISGLTQTSPSGGAASVATEEKSPGPTAYWRFDEGYGITANDQSVNANAGTLSGSTLPTWQNEESCVSGKCLYFSNGAYVSAGNPTSLQNTGAFTTSAWIRSNDLSSSHVILAKYGTGTNLSFRFSTNSSGNLVADVTADGSTIKTLTSGTVLSINQWYHVALVFVPSTSITLYVNGNVAQFSGSSIPASVKNSTANFLIGSSNTGSTNNFSGYIDDPKYYNYARTDSQIKTDYNAKSSAKGASTFGASDAAHSLSQGLVGYWKMDETSWTNNCSTASVLDSSGNGNNGTACPNSTGPTGGAAGKFGNAGSFDGSNDYVDVANSSSLSLSSAVTVSAWIYPTVTSQNSFAVIASKESGSTGYMLQYSTGGSADKLQFIVGNGSTFISTSTVASAATVANTWYHVVGVASANNSVSLYINGTLVSTTALSGSIGTSSSNVNIGKYPGGNSNYFTGKIDDLRIYNRAFSPAEIKSLYEWAPPPVFYAPLDEGTGTTTVHDISTSSNNVTMNGSMTQGNWVTGKFGKALYFDGVDDTLTNADNNILDIDNNVTVSAWINFKPLTAGNEGIVGKQGDYNMYVINNGKLGAKGSDSCSEASSNSTMSPNTWYYVTWTYDESINKFYINGVLDNSVSNSCNITTNGLGGLRIAAGDSNFNGYIDDVKIYNYIRTPKQIVSDMNGGHPSVGSPVGSAIGYWKFDEGNGTTANNSGSAGSVLNGTLTNLASPATTTSGWTNSGKSDKALNFDGSNDYVNLGSNAALDDIHGFTLSAWILPRSTSGGFGRIVDKDQSTAGWNISVCPSSDSTCQTNRIYLKQNFSSGTGFLEWMSAPNSLTLNTWQHVVVVYDNSLPTNTPVFYINGQPSSSSTGETGGTGSPQSDAAQALTVGNRTAVDRAFDGVIDEVKVYNYMLTPAEVKTEYNQGKSQVLGALSTSPDGKTASSSAERSYCVPGDTTTCNPPILEYNFDEGSGTTINDISGNANTGTLTNGPSWISGKIGKGVSFDGCSGCSKNDWINAGSATSLDALSALTTSMWVYPKSAGENSSGTIIAKADNTGTTGWVLYTNDGATSKSLEFYHACNTTPLVRRTSANTLSLNTWQHITLTWDGSTTASNVHIYVNGVEATYASTQNCVGGKVNDSTQNLAIGNDNATGNTWDGYIDNFKVYNYVRSISQITWDYNRGKPLGWWKFDECTGSTAYDSSGNSNNGTLTITGAGTYTSTGNCNSGSSSSSWNAGSIGKYNSSLALDGTNDMVSITANSLFNITTDITISAWINRTGIKTNDMGILGKTNLTNLWDYDFYVKGSNAGSNQDKLTLFNGSSETFSSGKITADSTWHHAVVTRSGSTVTFYIDGNAAGTGTYATAFPSNSLNLNIGYEGGSYYPGLIDDVRLYNYGLTATQIKILYNENSTVRFGPQTGSP